MISLGSLLKVVVLRDVRQDFPVAIPVPICVILHLYIMQFIAWNAAQEQRKVANTNVRDLVEIYANRNANSYYPISLYLVDTSLSS